MYKECPICDKRKTLLPEVETGRYICSQCIDKRSNTVKQSNLPSKVLLDGIKKKKIKKKVNKKKRVRKKVKKKPNTKKREKRFCVKCSSANKVSKYPNSDIFLCRKCYRSDPANHRLCDVCGGIKSVYKKTENGYLCPTCVRRSVKKVCFVCKREAVVRKKIEGEPYCDTCARKHPSSQKQCSVCGEKKFVAKYMEKKPVCNNCYQKKRIAKCVKCGEEKKISGKGLCMACYQYEWRKNKQKKEETMSRSLKLNVKFLGEIIDEEWGSNWTKEKYIRIVESLFRACSFNIKISEDHQEEDFVFFSVKEKNKEKTALVAFYEYDPRGIIYIFSDNKPSSNLLAVTSGFFVKANYKTQIEMLGLT